MPDPTIVFGPVIEPDVRAIGDELLPPYCIPQRRGVLVYADANR